MPCLGHGAEASFTTALHACEDHWEDALGLLADMTAPLLIWASPVLSSSHPVLCGDRFVRVHPF